MSEETGFESTKCGKWLSTIRWCKNGFKDETINEETTISYVDYSILYIILFSVYNFGWAFLIGFVGSVMFPKDIIVFIGDEFKPIALGVILGIAAFIQFLLGPLIGNISDRSKLFKIKSWEIGKRKPYIYVGTALYLITIIGRTAFKWDGVLWCFFMYAIVGILGNALSVIGLTTYTALFPDLFHPQQYDLVSAILGFSQLLGGALAVGGFGFLWTYINYYVLVGIVTFIGFLTIIPIVVFKEEMAVNNLRIRIELNKRLKSSKLGEDVEDGEYIDGGMADRAVLRENEDGSSHIESTISEEPISRRKFGCKSIWRAIWKFIKPFLTPFSHRNFRWVFLARFIFMFSIASMQSFLLYFLRDCVKDELTGHYKVIVWTNIITSDEQAQSVVAVIIFFFGLVSSFTGPWLSNKMQRKYVVCLSGVVMIIASLAFIASRNFTVICCFSPIMGMGLGAFYAVDMALINEVLPKINESAKDLAIFSIASVVPFAVAGPIMGGLIILGNELVKSVRGFGYFLLFGFSVFVQILGSIFVTFVKKKNKNEEFQELLDELEMFDEDNIDMVVDGDVQPSNEASENDDGSMDEDAKDVPDDEDNEIVKGLINQKAGEDIEEEGEKDKVV